jgi:transcription termination factor Rho
MNEHQSSHSSQSSHFGRGRHRRRRGRGNFQPQPGGGGDGPPSGNDDRYDDRYDDRGGDDREPAGDDRADGPVGNGPAGNGGGNGGGEPAPAEPSLAVPADKTVVIGITGEPGAGKSSLARQLAGLGGTLIDVDEIAHELIETPVVKKALVKQFGEDILGEDGGIDRRKLAAKAFVNAESTTALNHLVHPKLAAKVKALLKKSGNFTVIDAAVLHELQLGELCTTSIYVRAPREARLARVAERGWDEAELARREAALGAPDLRRKACQLAVDNGGDPALLAVYAKTILARQLGIDLMALRRQRPPAEPPPEADDDGAAGDEPRADRPERPAEARPPGAPPRPAFANPDARPPIKVDLDDYLKRILPDLQGEADKLDVRDVKWLKKHDLICEILRRVAGGRLDEILVEGYIELIKDQQGYIRSQLNNYLAVSTDTFITNQQIRRYGIKAGMHVTGTARSPRGNERCPQLLTLTTLMGEQLDHRTPVQDFEHLIPLHAHDRLFMELPNDPTDYNLRIVDLVSPIGKGQRGLIVAQPKCGKTVFMQKIAKAIATNNPEVTLMVLLVDERPEEVTDMQRSVKGEVVASTFDQHASRHVQCAEMVINKAKRLVERGQDVVILLDSITRLARAYNTEAPNSGRIMSGGIDSNALIKPKQFFGAARKIENGGSLTILATAIVDTGSLMDTIIFEEFKGTGNMELVLDRRLANRRIFPAVDCAQSGTRKDDLLIKNEDELKRVWALRKFLAERNSADAIEFLKSKLKNYRTNIEFLLTIDPDKMSSW